MLKKNKPEILILDIPQLDKLIKLLFANNLKLNKIMAEQKDAAAKLNEIATQLAKANTEIQAKIQELVDAAAVADDVTPELQAAIDALVPAAQALDDVVPDAPTT